MDSASEKKRKNIYIPEGGSRRRAGARDPERSVHTPPPANLINNNNNNNKKVEVNRESSHLFELLEVPVVEAELMHCLYDERVQVRLEQRLHNPSEKYTKKELSKASL